MNGELWVMNVNIIHHPVFTIPPS